jgi:RimJ/RimL family protein N-acetyltransferase
VLAGRRVRLEPVGPEHEAGLYEAARPPEIWSWICKPPASTPQTWRAWFAAALEETDAGREAAFATLDARSGTPIGATRFLALRPENRGLEIGWTWLTPSAWRTGRTASSTTSGRR